MGIKGLYKFLEPYNIRKLVDLRDLNNKIVAIDISTYIYKNLSRTNEIEEILKMMLYFFSYFRKYFIHIYIVFDSKPPNEKIATIQKRNEERERKQEYIDTIEREMKEYSESGMVTKELQKLGCVDVILSPNTIDVGKVTRELDRLRLQTQRPSPNLIKKIKEMLKVLRIPYINAPTEAEKYCASLLKANKVHHIITEDSDTLCYGVSILSKLDRGKHIAYLFDHNHILKTLEMNEEQFRDFCILCGTDYNHRVKGIGPQKAYQRIKGGIKPEDLAIDYDVNVIRNLFGHDQVKDVSYCLHPDMKEIEEFVENEGISGIWNLENMFPKRVFKRRE